MNLKSGNARLVLLCPTWKKWGAAKTVKPGTVILHSRAYDVIPFADSEELVRNSGLPESALIEVGTDHRLADTEPLAAMLKACLDACVPNWSDDEVDTLQQDGAEGTPRRQLVRFWSAETLRGYGQLRLFESVVTQT